ncbi:MAG: AgmX/PglI C-terminal domain-containing protein [Oligoflexia bacterium]|nr:AgmX/PglI C-terminal domain-containing protein [Oligoflexia bacterium]
MVVQNVKIGLLQDGKLLREFVIDDTRNVTVGSSMDNTITVFGSDVPRSMTLLEYSRGVYHLNVHGGLRGRLFDAGNITTLDDSGRGQYELSDNVRGSIEIGRNTLLFKVYPSESVPLMLPKEFRGSIAEKVDLSFLFIAVVLFIAYFMLISAFQKVIPREKVHFDEVPERFARLILDKPIVIKQKKKEVVNLDKPEKPVVKNAVKTGRKEKQKKADVKRNIGGTKRKGGGSMITKQNAAELVRTAGIIGIIGSKGSKKGAVANLFGERDFGQKLNKALKGVAGLHAGKTLNEARMRRGAGSAEGVDIGSLKTTTGTGAVAFGSSNVSAVNVLGNLGDSDVTGEGSINPAVIAKTLARHVGAFQYCYNKALRGNPRLSGELKIRFTILLNGNVSTGDIRFSGPASKDGSLTSCIYRTFLRIKFPSPKGGEVTVNYPLNFTAQN